MSARIDAQDESKLESWEGTTPGTVWVWIYDRRNDSYKKARIGGRGAGGTNRINITVGDRRYNQEQVVDEMRANDPFTNGMLIRTKGPELTEDDEFLQDTSNHKTNVELLQYFEIRNIDEFKEAIDDIESELILRRLDSLAHNNALASQAQVLRELIDQRYRVGGTQKTVQEMLDANDLQGGRALS